MPRPTPPVSISFFVDYNFLRFKSVLPVLPKNYGFHFNRNAVSAEDCRLRISSNSPPCWL
jgi:hypothetical protein